MPVTPQLIRMDGTVMGSMRWEDGGTVEYYYPSRKLATRKRRWLVNGMHWLVLVGAVITMTRLKGLAKLLSSRWMASSS